MELVVNIADAEIGEGARLAEALGVEGATELKESAFSSEGLAVTLERTADGKGQGDSHARRRTVRVLPAREGEVVQTG